MSKCELCGEPMPTGEEMFKYHGYSGPCPKPPLPRPKTESQPAPQGVAEVMTLVESYAEARYCGESDDVSTYAPFAKHAELMQAVTALITERDALRTKDEAQAATIKRLQLYENLAAEYGLSAFPDMAALRARVTELGIALIEQTALTNAAIAAAKEPK